MNELNHIIDTLDEASDGFAKIADKQQKKMYEDVLLLVKELDTDSFGKVKQSIANLKRLTQIKAKLSKLAKDDEWVDGIGKFLQYFTKIQGEQMRYFTKTFAENTLTERAKEKHQLMKQMAVQNTIDGLVGTGLQANVTDKLNDILLRAVTSGEKFADLQQELHDHLMGVDGGTGAFSRYASTYATTAMTQFTGQNNKLLTDDLGLEWFMYVGSNKETTREFCEQLTKKRYIHKSEIPAILQGKIDDYQCAIYPKTGLPYGMIDGTNEDNFQCNCGGWNCRHQLVPVAAAAVPASIRARVGLINQVSTDGSISKQKGRDAFYNLLRENGWSDDAIKTEIDNMKRYGFQFDLQDDFTASRNQSVFYEMMRRANNRGLELDKLVSDSKGIIDILNSAGIEIGNLNDLYLDIKDPIIRISIRNEKYEDILKKAKELYKSASNLIDKDLSPKKDYKDDKNTKEIASLLGIKGNANMKFSLANNGRTNPKISTDKDEYKKNCQRCVVAFEMRLRGLNVEASKRILEGEDPYFTTTGYEVSKAWINKESHNSPVKEKIYENTYELTSAHFDKSTKENGRYILEVVWDGVNFGHVVNVIRGKHGSLMIYDPQNSTSKRDIRYYYEGARFGELYVYRIDDCELNIDVAKLSLVGLK